MQEMICSRLRRDELLEAVPIASYIDDDYAPGVGSFDLWAMQADDGWFTLAVSDMAFEDGRVNAIVAVPIAFNSRGLLDVSVVRALAPLPGVFWEGMRCIENFPFSGPAFRLTVPWQSFAVFETDDAEEAEAMRQFLHARGYDPQHLCQIQTIDVPPGYVIVYKDPEGTTFHVESATTGRTGATPLGRMESYRGRMGHELVLPRSFRDLGRLLVERSTSRAALRAVVRRVFPW